MYNSKYFKTEQLVSQKTFEKMRDDALKYIPAYVVETLDTMREDFEREMVINTWHKSSIGYYDHGLLCFADNSYKATVERSQFYAFNKKWFGLEFVVKFFSIPGDMAVKMIEEKNYDSIKSVKVSSKPEHNGEFVVIEFKGNE